MSYGFHGLCLAFRAPLSTELDVLAADIKANGLLERITLYQGVILDGRCRYLACQKAGVTPSFWTLPDDADPVAYVISKNRIRRHETLGERALAGQRVKEWKEQEAAKRQKTGKTPTLASAEAKVSGKAAAEAAKLVGTSRATVERADKVTKKGTPELVEAMRSGKVSPTKAAKLADLSPAEQLAAIQTEGKRALQTEAKDVSRACLTTASKALAKASRALEKTPNKPKGLAAHLAAVAAAVAWLAALLGDG